MIRRLILLWAVAILPAAIGQAGQPTIGQAGLVPSIPGDPDFVSPGTHRGYYMVTSGSGRWWRWGLARAPVIEPTRFTSGYGADVIAIPFDAKGRVAFAPVYIYTMRPQSWQTRRLDSVILGKTSQAEIRQIFGRPDIQGSAGGYTVWFYQIRVYNPLDEFPDLH